MSMKTKYIIYVIFSIVIILLLKSKFDLSNVETQFSRNSKFRNAHSLDPQIRETKNKERSLASETPDTSPLILAVAGLSLPLSFPDSASDPVFQRKVAKDLQMIYGHLKGYEIIKSPTSMSIEVGGKIIKSYEMLNFTGKGRYFPKAIEEDVGHVGIIDGHDTLLVSDKMVEAYRVALALEERQPHEFSELGKFVQALNKLSDHPINNVQTLFLVDPSIADAKNQLSELSPESFSQLFGTKQYRSPSVLEVGEADQFGESYKGKLAAKIYIKSGDAIEDAMPPIIFDNGKWKFLILIPPT